MDITNLTIILMDKKFKREIYVEFAKVDIPLSCNTILEPLILSNHGVIISMECVCLKLPTIESIAVARENQKSAQEYYKQSTKVIC